MRRIILAAALAVAGLSSVPAFAHDAWSGWRYDRETRRDLAHIHRERAELQRDLWAYRHGARNWREIEADRRDLRRAEFDFRRDLNRRW
jgi:hypothetical protein